KRLSDYSEEKDNILYYNYNKKFHCWFVHSYSKKKYLLNLISNILNSFEKSLEVELDMLFVD
ncbi:hypothetical protein, partial [Vibrio parahaemolyticus]|uniref:hypothetical protein n=1 Tax=Vibrio parahaemolyticus TaxID=670 RepID=UPI002113646F